MNGVDYFIKDLYMELYILIHVVEGHAVSMEYENVDIPQTHGQTIHVPGKRLLKIENEGWFMKHRQFGRKTEVDDVYPWNSGKIV